MGRPGNADCSRSFAWRRGAALLLAALLGGPPASGEDTVFFYQLDRVDVVGNASSGAGCVETFDGGFGGWTIAKGNPEVSGGLVTFQNPGEHEDTLRTFYDVRLDREDLEAPPACRLHDGGGDATITSEWLNHVPALPGGFHGHIFLYQISPTRVEGIGLHVVHFSPAMASEFGTPPGLSVALGRLLLDVSDPSDIVLAEPMDFQLDPITQVELSAATGNRVYLRLVYDESAKTVVGSYSLDGELGYQTPFTPMASQFSSFGEGRIWVTGDPMTLVAQPAPGLSPVAAALLLGLLGGAAAARARRRGR